MSATTAIGHDSVAGSSAVTSAIDAIRRGEGALQRVLARYSVPALRVALGLVFLVFGVLKFFPGASPIEPLVVETWSALSFGVVSGYAAMALTASLETVVGITLVTGQFVRFGLVVLAFTFVGILSPLVLFSTELFTAAGPTLTAQYILKDVVLIAAALVVASRALHASPRR
ncbi:MAG: DoxX family membrane protein [Leifsonia sp.]